MSAGPAESDRLGDHPHPREAGTLLGHEAAELDLLKAYRAGRLPHAWLIGGPEGIGKATLAWRFARFVLAYPDATDPVVQRTETLAVPADHPVARQTAAGGLGDIAVLRRESNEKTGRLSSQISVDNVRRSSALFQQASRTGGYRICILDSAEDLNTASANALLKLIEEPPPRSLFLVVAHRPGRLLPTLRSRCRMLLLRPLAPETITEVLRGLGVAGEGRPEALAEAVTRAGGSVRAALHWLGGERLSLYRETGALLDRLPETDWRGLHRLADRITAEPDDFALMVEAVLEWLHGRMRRIAEGPSPLQRRLAPLTEVWDKIRRSARDAEILNLDKRTTLFSIFADLAHATRSP